MQQTEKYKLNLIESSDTFLPEGLNQNTRKIEAAMTAHEAAVGATTADLDARVTVLEGRKVALGNYLGTCFTALADDLAKEQFIYLGFRPRVGVFWLPNTYMTMLSYLMEPNDLIDLRVADDGFYVKASMNSGSYPITYLLFS